MWPTMMELALAALLGAAGADWGYDDDNGPRTWPGTYPSCRGRRQSPIHIADAAVTRCSGPALVWRNYNATASALRLVNNGNTVMLRGRWEDVDKTPQVGLGADRFVFDSAHFHWGIQNCEGSEHMLNEERYPLEMDVVHIRHRGGRRRDKDSLLTIAILFSFGEDNAEHAGLQRLDRALDSVRACGQTASVPADVVSLLVPRFRSNFYVYHGSLTTPPCSETVLYVVSAARPVLSQRQVESFRRLSDCRGRPILENTRPVQPLNNRTVKFVT